MSDFTNVSAARENEDFADSLNPDDGVHRNWIVIVRFYSLLHFIEERLQDHNYDSRSHDDRLDNIEKCPAIDSSVYNTYRALYDLSRDARYECIRMGTNELSESERRLEEGKELLGFDMSSGDTKYSIND